MFCRANSHLTVPPKDQWKLNKESEIEQIKKAEIPGISKTQFDNKRFVEFREKPQINEYKSMSAGLLYQDIWKNPVATIPAYDYKDRDYKLHYPREFHEVNEFCSPQQHLLSQAVKQSPTMLPVPQRCEPVDAWIDELTPYETSNHNTVTTNQDITMAWLLQQNLPCIQIPLFNGSPFTWVEFVIKFKDIVHDQTYLNNTQKLHYLHQHVSGEAKRAIHGFSNDRRGYILSLKRLKYTFGQRSKIAQAHLAKVTRGKQISNDDDRALLDFYYTISDCLITLQQLNYDSDIYSTDVLRQTIRRLPSKFYTRWGEHCLKLRVIREPTLVDLEAWLHDRIQATTDPYLPQKRDKKFQKFSSEEDKHKTLVNTTGVSKTDNQSVENKCSFCKANHRFYKCQTYNGMTPIERFNTVKGKKLCYNCFKNDHFTKKCKSKNTCFKDGCSAKHHTSLHDYFLSKRLDKDKTSAALCLTKRKVKTVKVNTCTTNKFSERVFSTNSPSKK